MRYERLGSTDLQVSRICFGGGLLADGPAYGGSEEQSIAAVRFALDAGVNFFDTSFWYGYGRGEELLAEALGSDRRNVIVATKVGLHLQDGAGIRDSRPERIIRHIDSALRRLKTDYVDIYQIHWPDPHIPFEESWAAMERVRESGKARFIGVSNYRPDEMRQCMTAGAVHTLQACYHALRREMEERELPFCREHDIGVMVWGPMAHGLLTGKFSSVRPPDWPPGDWRLNMPIMRGDGFRRSLEMIDQLTEFAAERGHTLMELAIAWCLSVPGITSVITGSRSPAHVAAQLGGADWELTESERRSVADILGGGVTWSGLGGTDDYGGHVVLPVEERERIEEEGAYE